MQDIMRARHVNPFCHEVADDEFICCKIFFTIKTEFMSHLLTKRCLMLVCLMQDVSHSLIRPLLITVGGQIETSLEKNKPRWKFILFSSQESSLFPRLLIKSVPNPSQHIRSHTLHAQSSCSNSVHAAIQKTASSVFRSRYFVTFG